MEQGLISNFDVILLNFVWSKEKDECEIGIKPVGCFNEVKDDRELGEEIYNEVDPSSPVFAGHLLGALNWKKDFPLFLYKGYDYFGVNKFGAENWLKP